MPGRWIKADTWSPPETIVEGSVPWSDLFTSAGSILHRFWQEEKDNNISLWHEVSLDAGLTWSQPENVTNFGDFAGLVSLMSDPAGRVHVMEAAQDSIYQNLVLNHWIYDGKQWSSDEKFEIGSQKKYDILSMAAALGVDDRLLAIYDVANKPLIANSAEPLI